jgi:hypothetical protein
MRIAFYEECRETSHGISVVVVRLAVPMTVCHIVPLWVDLYGGVEFPSNRLPMTNWPMSGPYIQPDVELSVFESVSFPSIPSVPNPNAGQLKPVECASCTPCYSKVTCLRLEVSVCNAVFRTTSTAFCTHDVIYMVRMFITRNRYYSCTVRSSICSL